MCHAGFWCLNLVMFPYVRWSSGMSRMSGILILRCIQLKWEIPFVSYCFHLDKVVYIFRTTSPILMRFLAKQLSECFHKWTTKLEFDSGQHKTHFAWSHHIMWYNQVAQLIWSLEPGFSPVFATFSLLKPLSKHAINSLPHQQLKCFSTNVKTNEMFCPFLLV